MLYDGYLFAYGLKDTVLSNSYKPTGSSEYNEMITLW